jgi:hypothetical protein
LVRDADPRVRFEAQYFMGMNPEPPADLPNSD